MANRTLHEFSTSTMANISTGPTVNVGDNGFELKPALINMVQASQFCGKAHEDGSAHLQHFLEICNTFTIKGVSRDDKLLGLFPFSLLGKAKQWFYSNKDRNTTWDNCSTTIFFPQARPMLYMGESQAFSNNMMNLSLRHGIAFKIILRNALIMGWRIGYSCRRSTMG